jgi:hypothetical protein
VQALTISTGQTRTIATLAVELNFARPQWLPDGQHVLVTMQEAGNPEGGKIYLLDAQAPNEPQPLGSGVGAIWRPKPSSAFTTVPLELNQINIPALNGQAFQGRIQEAVLASLSAPWWSVGPRHAELTAGDFTIWVYAADDLDLKQFKADLQARNPHIAPYEFPGINAQQMFVQQLAFVEFQGGVGVRYLTTYAQASYPYSDASLFYQFAGVTNDGRYYIFMRGKTVPPTGVLMSGNFDSQQGYANIPPLNTVSAETWQAAIEAFNRQAEEKLAQAPGDQFNLPLNVLDEFVRGINITP